MKNLTDRLNIKDLFNADNFSLNSEKFSRNQLIIFAAAVILSTILKIILLPYNMMHGEGVTRVWNALWWAQNPFMIMPNMNHPLYYYLMGPVILIFRDIYYAPILTMILIVTISGIYLSKISYILSDFKTALLTFLIFTLNPASFRLNFDPHPYSLPPLFYAITVYFLIKAFFGNNSRKNFIFAGIFTFLASFTRPEAIFVIICFCAAAYLSKKKGYFIYIVLSLWFQVFWILWSLYLYGTPFATYGHAAEYPNLFDIHGLSLALRLKGFFLPYFYMFMGLTIVIFYFFASGVYSVYKKYPKAVFVILFIPILVTALANGAASLRATIFHSTFYIYSMFYFGSVFAAFGLYKYMGRFKSSFSQFTIAFVVIVTAIPLSYVKEFVPQKFRGLFPKVVEFLETAPNPSEVRDICGIIDDSIGKYPSLILDNEGIGETTILYIAYRTKLTPPDKVLISTYNMPGDKTGLTEKVKEFVAKNRKGIIVVRNSPTLINQIISDNNTIKNWDIKLVDAYKSEHWAVYFYEPI
jgi:ABC-type multidrug transport system fused ATPase/permease subunit